MKKIKKIKKIAILSVSDHGNIGNRLQAYAMQKKILEFGFASEHIEFRKVGFVFFFNKLLNVILKIFFTDNKKNKVTFQKKHFFKSQKKISNFTKSFLKIKKYESLSDFKSEFSFNYSKLIVGSDVIWQSLNPLPLNFRFMSFLPKKLKFSYAASFGEQKIPAFMNYQYFKRIKDFNNISFREPVDSFYKKLDSTVDLDPTLLIKKTEWLSMQRKPNFLTDGRKFILFFILNNGKNKVSNDFLSRFNKNIRVIHAVDNDIGPQEFLYLINNSEFVITDSYHAIIFSLIFKKSFYSISRPDLGTNLSKRISYVLSIFNLLSRNKESLENIKFLDTLKYKKEFDDNLINRIKISNHNLKKIVENEFE